MHCIYQYSLENCISCMVCPMRDKTAINSAHLRIVCSLVVTSGALRHHCQHREGSYSHITLFMGMLWPCSILVLITVRTKHINIFTQKIHTAVYHFLEPNKYARRVEWHLSLWGANTSTSILLCYTLNSMDEVLSSKYYCKVIFTDALVPENGTTSTMQYHWGWSR